MSGRYSQSGPSDSAIAQDGDRAFLGVDMRRDPEQLEPGVAAMARNKSFFQGNADTRLGMRTAAWARELGLNFPIDFPVDFDTEQGFGRVYGQVTFSEPFGQERVILACRRLAYEICNGAPIGTIKYPNGLEITEKVTFTQAFNVLLMWRGELLNPLKLETGLDFNVAFAFEEVLDETNGDYTSTIPDAERAIFHGQRVWVMYDGSRVAYSDILNYTRYDADFSEIYVNTGSDDVGTALFPLGTGSILAFKSQSIYALNNVMPEPGQTSYLEAITLERGCVAAETLVQAGKDVLFLSDNGVYAVSQVLDNKLQARAEPISAPLQPLFDRINWAFAANAQAVVHDNRYLLAVPLDGAMYNNALLVYNFLNQAWEGWWASDFLDVAGFFRADVLGKRRLFVVTGANLEARASHGAIFLLDEGFTDVRFGEELAISDLLRTRAYTLGAKGVKSWQDAVIEVDTWHGAAEVWSMRDGVNESAQLGEYEKDRTKFYIFGMEPYDVTNAGGNHGEPFREDYSVALTTEQNWAAGINPGLHQRSSEPFRLRERSAALQIEIRGTRGRNCVSSVVVSAAADRDQLREGI